MKLLALSTALALSFSNAFAQRDRRDRGSPAAYAVKTRDGVIVEDGKARISGNGIRGTFENDGGDWNLTVEADGVSCEIDYLWTSLLASCDTDQGHFQATVEQAANPNIYSVWIGYTPTGKNRIEHYQRISLP